MLKKILSVSMIVVVIMGISASAATWFHYSDGRSGLNNYASIGFHAHKLTDPSYAEGLASGRHVKQAKVKLVSNNASSYKYTETASSINDTTNYLAETTLFNDPRYDCIASHNWYYFN